MPSRNRFPPSAIAQKLASERGDAESTVTRLLHSHTDLTSLTDHAALKNYGAVEYLGIVANETLHRDPLYALSIAKLAADVSETLPDSAYPPINLAQIRAHSWKNYGKVLGYLARYTEALDALHFAESCLASSPIYLGYDLAIVRFNIAVVLQEMNRCAESLPLLNECKNIFSEHGDTHLALLSAYAEGVGLHRLRMFREAREIYILLLSWPDIEPQTLASIHQSIGHCSIDLGDLDEAEIHLMEGIRLHRELAQPLQALKGEFGLGRLYLQKGDYARALAHLQTLRYEFLRQSLAEEAGLCGLEIVQALLRLDRRSEAENLARTVADEFTAAGLSHRATAALDVAKEIRETAQRPGYVSDERR